MLPVTDELLHGVAAPSGMHVERKDIRSLIVSTTPICGSRRPRVDAEMPLVTADSVFRDVPGLVLA